SRVELLKHLFESPDVAVGRVLGELRVLDGVHCFDFLRRDFGRHRSHSGAEHRDRNLLVELRGYDLRRNKRLERGLVQCPVALFGYQQNSIAHFKSSLSESTCLNRKRRDAHITLASNRSFSTSFAATSAGLPSSISVRFVFSGK